MNNIMRWTFVALGLALMAGFARPVSAETPINLLRLPSVTLEATSAAGDRGRRVSALTDGQRETSASIDADGAETVDFVFGFAGEIVAPEEIVVVLAKGAGGSPPARIEVLASLVSPDAGFKSLRADPINRSKPVQTFAFVPSAARWIMVRLSFPKNAKSVFLGEIEILGQPGEPKSSYAFKETPARVIDILARLEKSSPVSLAISEDEKRAFEKARAGRLDGAAFADVALLASGVLDPAKRKRYLDRIDAIAQKAQTALAQSRDVKERADMLLRWLHREVLKKGYRAQQTNLSVLLDDQTFNCVSSSVLYNIIALKLGIDVRAIEVPDHAFSIVYQGASHWDVETTTALGFNPSRDQIKDFERLTGFRYIADAHRDQRREITEAGLAALIYYNRGVDLGRARRHHEALLAYVRAMNLDAGFASAAKNALATLASWSYALTRERKWQQAVEVIGIGVELAPNDAVLVNNQRAIWIGWMNAEIQAGRFQAADDALERVAILAEADLANLTALLSHQWTQKAIKAGSPEDWQALAGLYARGAKRFPGHAALRNNVPYFFQEWTRAALAKGGGAAVVPIAREASDRFAAVPDAREAVVNVLINAVNDQVRTRKFEKATALVGEARDVLPPATLTQLTEFSYGRWAESHMAKKQWREAIDIYDRGLKLAPQSGLFMQNRAYCAAQIGQ